MNGARCFMTSTDRKTEKSNSRGLVADNTRETRRSTDISVIALRNNSELSQNSCIISVDRASKSSVAFGDSSKLFNQRGTDVCGKGVELISNGSAQII